MIRTDIRIARMDDTDPLFGDREIARQQLGLQALSGSLTHVGILEGGMQSGKTSIVLVGMVDGAEVYLQTSAEIFRTVAAALEGAEQRFISDPR